MANNLPVTPGVGATLSTVETTISATAAHVQRVSLGAGPSLVCANVAISSTSTAVDLFTANDNSKERMFQPLDGDVYVGPTGLSASTGFKITQGTIISTNYLGLLRVLCVNAGTVNVRTWDVT